MKKFIALLTLLIAVLCTFSYSLAATNPKDIVYFENGIALRIPINMPDDDDDDDDDNYFWEFVSEDADTINSPEHNKRTFTMEDDDDELFLSYQGKSSSGRNYGAPQDVYLTVSAAGPDSGRAGDEVTIEITEDGKKKTEIVTLDRSGRLRASVIKINPDGNTIDDVWIPRSSLVITETRQTPAPTPISTTQPTPDSSTDDTETPDNSNDDPDEITISIPKKELDKFVRDGSAKVVLTMKYADDNWVYVSRDDQYLAEDFSGLNTGSNSLILLGCILLVVVALASLGINLFIIWKNRR